MTKTTARTTTPNSPEADPARKTRGSSVSACLAAHRANHAPPTTLSQQGGGRSRACSGGVGFAHARVPLLRSRERRRRSVLQQLRHRAHPRARRRARSASSPPPSSPTSWARPRWPRRRIRRSCSRLSAAPSTGWRRRSAATRGCSRSSWATPSWPSSASRARTRTTRSGPFAPPWRCRRSCPS